MLPVPVWENMLIVEPALHCLLMLRLWMLIIVFCESWAAWKSETWRAVHSRILLPSRFFPPLENSQWRKVSPLQWIPFECAAHHWPRTGCNGGENSGILMQRQRERGERDIFGPQLNSVSLHLLSSDLNCSAVWKVQIKVQCHTFLITFHQHLSS